MEKFAKLIAPTDNVVISISDIKAGEEFIVKSAGKEFNRYIANQDIPFGHKAAIKDIACGALVLKYGEPIGAATRLIKKGDWVHTHNLKDTYEVQ